MMETNKSEFPMSTKDKLKPFLRSKDYWQQMDNLFVDLNLYRKFIPRDFTSIFRAISDALFHSQTFYKTVHQDLLEFITNLCVKDFFRITNQTGIQKHDYLYGLHNLELYEPSVIDLHLISVMYRITFHIYSHPIYHRTHPIVISKSGCKSTKLVRMFSNFSTHFDLLYTIETRTCLAMAQSVLYEMLYKRVFGLKEVEYVVDKMLNPCSDEDTRTQPNAVGGYVKTVDTNNCIPVVKMNNEQTVSMSEFYIKRFQMRAECRDLKKLFHLGITPFPYKVAKALDASIYRNVEFDNWLEVIKGFRTGISIWSNSKLIPGVACLVLLDGEKHKVNAHIQDIDKKRNMATVFVQKARAGQMMTVRCSQLYVLPHNQTRVIPTKYIRGTDHPLGADGSARKMLKKNGKKTRDDSGKLRFCVNDWKKDLDTKIAAPSSEPYSNCQHAQINVQYPFSELNQNRTFRNYKRTEDYDEDLKHENEPIFFENQTEGWNWKGETSCDEHATSVDNALQTWYEPFRFEEECMLTYVNNYNQPANEYVAQFVQMREEEENAKAYNIINEQQIEVENYDNIMGEHMLSINGDHYGMVQYFPATVDRFAQIVGATEEELLHQIENTQLVSHRAGAFFPGNNETLEMIPDNAKYFTENNETVEMIPDGAKYFTGNNETFEMIPDGTKYFTGNNETVEMIPDGAKYFTGNNETVEMIPDGAKYFTGNNETVEMIPDGTKYFTGNNETVEMIPDGAKYFTGNNETVEMIPDGAKYFTGNNETVEMIPDNAKYFTENNETVEMISDGAKYFTGNNETFEMIPDGTKYFTGNNETVEMIPDRAKYFTGNNETVEMIPDGAKYFTGNNETFEMIPDGTKYFTGNNDTVEMNPDGAKYCPETVSPSTVLFPRNTTTYYVQRNSCGSKYFEDNTRTNHFEETSLMERSGTDIFHGINESIQTTHISGTEGHIGVGDSLYDFTNASSAACAEPNGTYHACEQVSADMCVQHEKMFTDTVAHCVPSSHYILSDYGVMASTTMNGVNMLHSRKGLASLPVGGFGGQAPSYFSVLSPLMNSVDQAGVGFLFPTEVVPPMGRRPSPYVPVQWNANTILSASFEPGTQPNGFLLPPN